MAFFASTVTSPHRDKSKDKNKPRAPSHLACQVDQRHSLLSNSFTTHPKHVQLMHTLKHHTTLNNSSYSSFGPRYLAQSSATSVFVHATFPRTLPRTLRAVAECTPRVWADPSSLCFHKTPSAAQRRHRTPAQQCKFALAMSHPD